MKTKIRQTAAILAAAAIMTASFTACGKGTDNSGTDPNAASTGNSDSAQGGSSAEKLVKMEYKSELKELPEELGTVDAVSSNGEQLTILSSYIPSTLDGGDSPAKLMLSYQDAEGNITETKELPFTPDDGSAFVSRGFIAADGAVYYTMTQNDSSDPENVSSKAFLKSVKPDGSEGYTLDLSELSGGFDVMMNYVQGIAADNSGHALICTDSFVYGIDENGKEIFALDNSSVTGGSGYVMGAVQGSDSNAYVTYLKYGEDNYTTHIVKADFDAKAMGEDISVNGYGDYVFNMGGDYLAGLSMGSVVKGIKADGSTEDVINLANAGVDTSSAWNVFPVGENYSVWYNDTTDYSIKQSFVRKLKDSEMKEKTGISLTAVSLSSSLRSAVVNYNNSDGEYFIQITDYSSDDFETAKSKLNAEISSGNIPDIICTEADTIGEYAKKGILVDLNTYIDGENGLDRSKYFDNIFRGMETNGKLYAITDAFMYIGFGAKKSIIPEDGKISYADIEKIREQYEGIDVFPANQMTKSNFLDGAIQFGIQKFVNKDTGECSFDSQEFIDLLKLADEYPAEVDLEALANDPNAEAEMQTQYAANKTLFMPFNLANYSSYSLWEQAWFGEDMSSLGFPGLEEDPIIMPISSIAVSAKSAHPEAGWELIKYMLSDEIQEKIPAYFPVNRNAMKVFADREIKQYEDYGEDKITYYVGTMELSMDVPDQKLIDRVNELIEKTNNVAYYDSENISEIITDEANSFFSGASTAETAAANIQSRVKLYLSEQE